MLIRFEHFKIDRLWLLFYSKKKYNFSFKILQNLFFDLIIINMQIYVNSKFHVFDFFFQILEQKFVKQLKMKIHSIVFGFLGILLAPLYLKFTTLRVMHKHFSKIISLIFSVAFSGIFSLLFSYLYRNFPDLCFKFKFLIISIYALISLKCTLSIQSYYLHYFRAFYFQEFFQKLKQWFSQFYLRYYFNF